MKKKIISVIMSVVMLFGVCSLSSCGIGSRFESDGRFVYEYDESKDGYIIVNTGLFGYSDPMYVPAYYKGKPIISTGYHRDGFIGGGEGTSYYIDYGDAKKVYLPFGVAEIKILSHREVYVSATEALWHSDLRLFTEGENTITYMTTKGYDFLLNDINTTNNLHYDKNGVDRYACKNYGYYFEFHEMERYEKGEPLIVVKKANTSYMFNYEGAPNNDYFFINNFENGALIENTPYEPLREGYVFDGWYKEAECINKCNFGTDVYVEQYDEEGNLLFNEMKLYAKWIKE